MCQAEFDRALEDQDPKFMFSSLGHHLSALILFRETTPYFKCHRGKYKTRVLDKQIKGALEALGSSLRACSSAPAEAFKKKAVKKKAVKKKAVKKKAVKKKAVKKKAVKKKAVKKKAVKKKAPREAR